LRQNDFGFVTGCRRDAEWFADSCRSRGVVQGSLSFDHATDTSGAT
jgi:hypothetical protein